MQQLTAVWSVVRWVIAAVVVGGGVWLLVGILLHEPSPENIPSWHWYGNWRAVLIVTAVFALFVLGFVRPRQPREWGNAGIYVAFLISLFTEMYGIPLTIYLLAPLLDYPSWAFGLNESHLWAFALERLGLMPVHVAVYFVMLVSMALIAAGVGLLAVGWATVHRGQEGLVTRGIYRHLRHPQYLGLILVVVGFNIQWPTLPTLLMGPVLIVMYVWLARREDADLATLFGAAFPDYEARTPAFIPWGKGAQVPRNDERSAPRSGTAVPEPAAREHQEFQ